MTDRINIPPLFARLGLPVLAALCIAAALITSGCEQGCRTQGDPEALIGGDISLTDHKGNRVSGDALKGHYQIVFFGFTSCPDICPSALQNVSVALDMMGVHASFFQPVFISIDPERDTPEIVAEYMSHFHESFVGLTGTPEEIKEAAHTYRAYYARSASGGDDENYLMDHSAYIYVMDCEGRYIKHFYDTMPAEEMAAELKAML